MGVLQDFERRLEGAVEGFFARAFRSGVQPIELAKAVQRYAESNQQVTQDGVVVPNVYRLTLGQRDHDRLSGFGESLPRELGEVVVRTANDRGWILRGPAKVRIDLDDAVRYGRYRLSGRVEVVDGAGAGRVSGRAAGRAPARRQQHHGAVAAPRRSSSAGSSDARAPIDRTQVVGAVTRGRVELVARSGTDAGRRAPVGGQRTTIGRLPGCGLVLDDTTVSREHAALIRRGDTWWVVDLGSTNGTRVNGVQAAEQPVRPGDRIELGDAVVELVGD